MKEYFINLLQDIKEDCFPGKDNVEIILEVIAHAINLAMIISIVYIAIQEYFKFLNS
ncbi:MAG: hypothetical protein ACI4V7_04300 [Succinivibrionaceae bacterium]